MSKTPDLPDIQIWGKKLSETAKAVQVETFNPTRVGTHWFPISQIKSMHFGPDGSGFLVVTDWICWKKGIKEQLSPSPSPSPAEKDSTELFDNLHKKRSFDDEVEEANRSLQEVGKRGRRGKW
jgi:hypothetical protein